MTPFDPDDDAAAESRLANFLRGVPLFRDLPGADLERLAGRANVLAVPAGSVVVEEGGPGGDLYVLMEGELEVTRRDGDRDVVLAVQQPGAVLGEMSLIEEAPRNATIRAGRESQVLVLPAGELEGILAASPGAALTLIRTFAGRLRSTEASLRQSARLAALGTMAAGLAHELNNPAAALARGAHVMADAADELDRQARRLGQLGLGQDVMARLDDIPLAGRSQRAEPLTGAELMRAEDELASWLLDRAAGTGSREPGPEAAADPGPAPGPGADPGPAPGWMLDPALAGDMAADLATCGWTPGRLEDLLDELASLAPGRTFPMVPVLAWLAARCAAASVAEETRAAAGAISEIVGAVRSHTYLGQAPVQAVDVAAGLESALVLMRGRIEPGVRVIRDLAPDLPRIDAHGGELNQVWVNLLDNALRALDGHGILEIRASRHGDGVRLEISDSGPGIPDDVLPRIFDPFFTTRPFGTGTGLGLHVTATIVRRHRGRIGVESRPGRTTFTVELPISRSPDGP
jgi:signal transduction histidine kinase